jgi:hypothetical protein
MQPDRINVSTPRIGLLAALASQCSAQELVRVLNDLFARFDKLAAVRIPPQIISSIILYCIILYCITTEQE